MGSTIGHALQRATRDAMRQLTLAGERIPWRALPPAPAVARHLRSIDRAKPDLDPARASEGVAIIYLNGPTFEALA
jgi:hypothetical protein